MSVVPAVAHSFIAIRVTSGERNQTFIHRRGDEITIGGSGEGGEITICNAAVVHCQATLVWSQHGELTIEPAPGANSTCRLLLDGHAVVAPAPFRSGQQLSVGNARVTWDWLPPEEWPTVAAASGSFPGAASATAELAAELAAARYERGAEVGRGGVGRVLEALEKPLHRAVALKVLLDRGEQADQQRFIREARITGRLEHPSIVPVHELNVDPTGHIFYTMKLVKGVTLLQVLQDLSLGKPEALRRYTLQGLLTIFQKVCDAVAFAHAQPEPIIHRDLKPDNIMIGDYGEVLVMDWGAAKILSRDGLGAGAEPVLEDGVGYTATAETGDTFVTQPGSIMGTPGYMAPEQARGQAAKADERTDIYALGAILYTLLTLEAPAQLSAQEADRFGNERTDGTDPSGTFEESIAPLLKERAHRRQLHHLPRRTVPGSLSAVVLKAMAPRPVDRFASVTELQADVAAYQAGRATTAEEARPWRRFRLLVARHRVLFGFLGATLAILLTATAISVQQRQAALTSNKALRVTLQSASRADHEAARQNLGKGEWRTGLALLGRSLAFWPENREAGNYLLSTIAFGRGDRDRLPIFGVRHDLTIGEAAFSPDGRYFATASHDHTTRIWDAATGVQIGKTLQHAGGCGMPSFSPDGRRVVTTGGDGVARLWDAERGEPLALPMRHGRPDLDALSDVMSGVFSPDGKRILTASLDHTARVWDASSGKEIAQLVNPHRVASAVFSPDGSRVLTSYWYGGAMLWDATTFQPIGSPMTHGATVREAIFTPDGNKIVTSSLDKTARIWDGHTAEALSPPLNHPDVVWEVDVSPDGKLFATACYDKIVRLWSVEDGSPVGLPMQHDGPVVTVAFSPNGERLVTASRDKTVRLWDAATSQQLGSMRHDETPLRAIFNPDGTKVLSVGWDGAGYLWHAEVPAWPGEVLPIPGVVRALEFDEDGDRVFVATADGQAALWSLNKKQFVTPVATHPAAIERAVFHSRTRQFATAGTDRVIRFWNASTGNQTGETRAEQDTTVGIAFSADGRSVFAAYLGGSVLQWRVPEGTRIGQAMKHSEKMDALAVAPSGTELATGCRDDHLRFWQTTSGNPPVRSPIRHGNPVLAIGYHPDGRTIATGCDDHTARIWSLDSGEQSGEPFTLNGRVTAVRYTAGGKALLVGGIEDAEVHCYDTSTRSSLYSLPHPGGVSQIAANASGSLVASVTNDGVARLWRISTSPAPPPKWLPEYLSALGGLSFSAGQQLAPVPTQERLKLREKLLQQPRDSSVWQDLMVRSFQQAGKSGVAPPPAHSK